MLSTICYLFLQLSNNYLNDLLTSILDVCVTLIITCEHHLIHLIPNTTMSICQNSSAKIFPKNPEKYVTNLSDFNLTKVHLEALSLGFKFSVPFNKPSRIDVESQFENLNSQLSGLQPSSKDNVSWFKARCVDLANQYMAYTQ